ITVRRGPVGRRWEVRSQKDEGRPENYVLVIDRRPHRAKLRLNFYLKMLFGRVLLEKGGVLLHASAIRKGEKVHIFVGKNRSGKSTLARLSRQQIIADDAIAVRQGGGKQCAYALPFYEKGKTTHWPKRCAIAGLYMIHKDRKTEYISVSPREAVSQLLPFVRFFGEAENMEQLVERALENLQIMVSQIPVGKLNFKKDDSFLRLLK
ncbi:MAG TPA: hypothetical protein VJ179_01750, partial [Patescibacteria group bacterium]|nr:hypothetical protein [Patescibacteria group bacterium]